MSIRRTSALLVTRRNLTALLVASPLAAQVTSKHPPQGAPAPPQPPATPQDRLQKAYADVRSIGDQLSKIELPVSLEPAYTFRA